MSVRTLPAAAPVARRGTNPLAWAVVASVAIPLLFVSRNTPLPGLAPGIGWSVFTWVRLLIEAAAFFVAAGRRELPARLRGSLLLLGSISVVSSCFQLWRVLGPPFFLPPLSTPLLSAWAFTSYFLPIVAVLLMPMAPFRRGEWWTFLLDLTVSVGGFVAITWLMQVAAAIAAQPRAWYLDNAVMGLVSGAGTLIALNLITLRRRAVPSRRAFWLLVAGVAAYLPVSLIFCVWPTSPRAFAWADGFYFLSVVPTIWAAWAMRVDPIEPLAEERPHWSRTLNPFALVTPALLSVALLAALRQGPAEAVWPLAVIMAVLTALLVVRLVLTAREHDRTLRAIAEREALEQRVRLESLRRVAGGVAHVFNNSLMTVLGNAEMGESSRSPVETRHAFERIRASAQQSVAFTRHLLWFTGRQFRERERLALGAWLLALEPEIRARATSRIEVAIDARVDGALVDADRAQLHEVLLELVQNALAAMPGGGRLDVVAERGGDGSDDEDGVARPLHLVVRDTGCGIAPEALPHVFEPFYSSHDLAESPGLGLAIAHGVVLAHDGRIDVRSTPGVGTEVRIRLPQTRSSEDAPGLLGDRR